MENPYESPAGEVDRPRVPGVRLIWPFAVGLAVPLVAEIAVLHSHLALSRFQWLASQSLEFVVFVWPVSLPVAFWLTKAIDSFLKRHERADLRFLWLIPVLVLPTTMLVWSAIHTAPKPHDYAKWYLDVLSGLFWAQLALGILAIVANRGQRSVVASTTVLAVLLALACCFVGGMNITGDWI